MTEPEPLSEENVAELAEFFDLLAKFDYEDKVKEAEMPSGEYNRLNVGT